MTTNLLSVIEQQQKAMERMHLWAESQADAQSKGGHATFDLMRLREERDAMIPALAAGKQALEQTLGETGEPEWNDENVIAYCIARGISAAKTFTTGATQPKVEPAPCEAREICLNCQPRNADGSCPDAEQKLAYTSQDYRRGFNDGMRELEPAPIDRKENARQNNLTATAMMEAPRGATYVWCNNELWYPIELCKKLQRPDIRIHWPRWLDTDAPYSVRGQIIVDHALRLTPEQRELINHINERNKP